MMILRNIFFTLFVGLVFFSSITARAQTQQNMTINISKFDSLCGATCAETNAAGKCIRKEYDETIHKKGKITGNLVRCMERVINHGGDRLITNFVRNFSQLVHYCILIGLAIWGFRMMFGIGRSRGLVSIMLLKLVLVLYITNPDTIPQLQKWRSGLIDFPKKFSTHIMHATKTAGSIINAPSIAIGDANSADIFDSYDEYILHLFGVIDKNMTNAEKQEAYNQMDEENMYFGIAALIGGLFFLGDIGASLTMVGVLFVFTVIVAVAQAILIFTTITIALNIIMALAPLAVTCILFDPVKKITTTWFFSLIGYSIQPIILTAFVGLTLGILDNLVSGTIAGGEPIISEAYRDVKIKFDSTGTSNGIDETTMVSCDRMKLAAKSLAGAITQQGSMGGLRNMSVNQLMQMEGYSSGANGSGVTAELADNIEMGLAQGCELIAKTISIESNEASVDNSEDTDGEITEDELKDLQGVQLAVSVLMIMLISFLRKVPDLAHEMTKSGSLAPLTKVAGGLGDTTRKFVVGDSNSGGAIGMFRNGIKSGMK